MQFRDLNKQYLKLKKEIDDGILEVINSSSFILGQKVFELEGILSEYVGRKHCITCGNGTDALVLALRALNIGNSDVVFTPDFTYIASASCIKLAGASPFFVDIDLHTFNMSSVALEKAIIWVKNNTKLTPKAVIVVDLFGLPANFREIEKIASKYGIFIIEDAAQGFGGEINGQKACSFGDISCTSFFPAKPLGCYGDGGAIFTNDDKISERLISLRSGGKSPFDKYDNREIGVNSRLDTIQAAVLIPKFKAFKNFELDSINKIANQYSNLLHNFVIIPKIPKGFLSSWAQYTILLKDEKERAFIQKNLKSKGIPTMIYYPRGMHQQQAFDYLHLKDEMFPNTSEATKRVLSLPIHPYLSIEEIQFICKNIIEEIKKYEIQ